MSPLEIFDVMVDSLHRVGYGNSILELRTDSERPGSLRFVRHLPTEVSLGSMLTNTVGRCLTKLEGGNRGRSASIYECRCAMGI